MPNEITQLERDAMSDLSTFAKKAMRSKPTLRVLSRLMDKGWIDFSPFEGTASITEAGKKALERR